MYVSFICTLVAVSFGDLSIKNTHVFIFSFLFFAEKVVFDLKQKKEIISVLAVTESKCDSCAYCVMGYLRGAE